MTTTIEQFFDAPVKRVFAGFEQVDFQAYLQAALEGIPASDDYPGVPGDNRLEVVETARGTAIGIYYHRTFAIVSADKTQVAFFDPLSEAGGQVVACFLDDVKAWA